MDLNYKDDLNELTNKENFDKNSTHHTQKDLELNHERYTKTFYNEAMSDSTWLNNNFSHNSMYEEFKCENKTNNVMVNNFFEIIH